METKTNTAAFRGCDTVLPVKQITAFRRKIPPPSSLCSEYIWDSHLWFYSRIAYILVVSMGSLLSSWHLSVCKFFFGLYLTISYKKIQSFSNSCFTTNPSMSCLIGRLSKRKYPGQKSDTVTHCSFRSKVFYCRTHVMSADISNFSSSSSIGPSLNIRSVIFKRPAAAPGLRAGHLAASSVHWCRKDFCGASHFEET